MVRRDTAFQRISPLVESQDVQIFFGQIADLFGDDSSNL